MTTFPGSPYVQRGGIVTVNPTTLEVLHIISLQYNPHTMNRSLQLQGAGEGGDRLEALRLKGPPVETIKVEIELDITDQLETANPQAVQLGLYPQLAILERLLYPSSEALKRADELAQQGKLEIAPAEAPLTLFIWSKNRILPVRITEFSVTEEAFDPTLNPIRAKISLGMRVLSVNDLGFGKAGSLFMSHLQQKETLAELNLAGTLSALGIGGIT